MPRKEANAARPCFELRQIRTDGTEEARLCTLTELFDALGRIHMSRRGFIALSGLATAASIIACGGQPEETTERAPRQTVEAEPTERPTKPRRAEPDDLTCASIRAHSDEAFELAFSPDGKLLASCGGDGRAKLWDLTSNELITILEEQAPVITSPVFSQDGSTLAWVLEGERVVLWDVASGKVYDSLQDHPGAVWVLAFSPDSSQLAAAGEGGLIELWDWRSKALLWSKETGSTIMGLQFAPDGKMLIAGDADGSIKFWDVAKAKRADKLEGKSGAVLSLCLSHDGLLLAWAGSDTPKVKLWDVESREVIASVPHPAEFVTRIAISPDGRWLASIGDAPQVLVIDVASGEVAHTLEGTSGDMRSVAFKPDGKLLATGDAQGSIAFYETDTFDPNPAYCLFDPEATSEESEANVYRVTDSFGITRTYTLPCGAPIPPGAICTCDCVPGTFAVPGPARPSGGGFCTCDEVCTCVPVCICMMV